uniref:Uncharacterized protein n=1 Tax=Quercus lobata TaxID=97700 RepID=A0A7N2LV52_QUELO
MSASVTQHLHSPVVSHSSLSHPQSATPKAVASNIVSQRNVSIHQERVLSEKAMVKMIGWEVKNRVECSSYWNSVQNRGIDTSE